MRAVLMLVVASVLLSLVRSGLPKWSSRRECKVGNNDFCERYDYEGACCARVKVTKVDPFSTANEQRDQEFLRCYNIDDIYKALDNEDLLLDNSKGGSNNTYRFKCTEPASSVLSAEKGI